MAMRIPGMSSGLDTESIVAEMVKAYSKKKEDLTKSQTILGWKQESYATLNTKFKKLYTKTMGNLKFASSYNKKSTVISDPAVAKIVAGDGAVNGTQTLRVKQLAKAGYLTGGKLTKDKDGNAINVTGSTSLKDMGILADGEKATLNMKVNGKSTDIDINADTTIDSLVSSLNNAGVSASFDAVNKRLFMNVTESGEQADFSLTAVDPKGLDVLAGLRLVTANDISDLANFDSLTTDEQDAIYLAEYKALKDSYQGKLDKEVKNQGLLQKERDRLAGLTTGLEDKVNKYTNSGDADYDADVANAMNLTGNARKEALQDLTKKDGAWSTQKTAAEESLKKVAAEDATQAEKDALVAEKAEAAKFLEKYNAVESLGANYAGIESCDTGIATSTANQAKYTDYVNNTGDILLTETTNNLADKILKAKETMAALGSDATTGPVRIDGTDAEIYLNGAQYTSSTNSFTVNNLTITAQEVTGDKEVSISTSEDVDAVYNVIKGFIKEYNDLIKDMDTKYNAASSKGYDPLTSEEKEALSDEEVKKWEDKIKDSVLRRDTNLGSNISFFKTSMLQSFNINGTNYSLASFGIETMGLDAATNEKGVYHIAGDKDDSDSADDTDKLKTMLATNKDDVVGFFTKLTDDMYGKLKKKTESNDYRTSNNMYEDKRLTKEYTDYSKQIAEQEKKIARMEDKYYKQFSAMEVALSKLNSQQSSLAGLLG